MILHDHFPTATRAPNDSTKIPPDDGAPSRLLSEAECRDIARRIAQAARGGGETTVTIWSTWTANVRWGRNQLTTLSEVQNVYLKIFRQINGAAVPWVLINDTSDAALVAACRRAERLLTVGAPEREEFLDLRARIQAEPYTVGPIFSESTYALDADHRAATALAISQQVAAVGLLTTGYAEVGAHAMALVDTLGHTQYVPYTTAQLSVTVRDPKGTGSGWAGVDWPDWAKIDGAVLAATAVDKCVRSRNPVAVEPGRYTTILEPQAVGDFVSHLERFELSGHKGLWNTNPPTWKMKKGEVVIDPRITISVDPADPLLAFPPINLMSGLNVEWWNPLNYDTYHPATWIEHGVLKDMAYPRTFGEDVYARATGLPQPGAFRMSGGETALAEMIATTQRGLLVTRFWGTSDIQLANGSLVRGYTRDGLWLIENGKISKAAKNMMFVESIIFALNNVEQLGVPQRIFHPMGQGLRDIPAPIIVPPLKIRDFSFTALCDAI